MYECVMGMRNFDGEGCILADDMGLGTYYRLCARHYLVERGYTFEETHSGTQPYASTVYEDDTPFIRCEFHSPHTPFSIMYYI